MKAKKILSMVLVGVTAIGLLAGCSSNTTDTQGSSADDAAQTESQDTAEGSAEETENQSGTDDSTDAASGDGNVLVVYYSATGNTEAAANYIADATGGDLFELEPVEPYTDEDLNYSDENSRVSQEYADESLREVELVSTEVENWDSYDTVFIGYPLTGTRICRCHSTPSWKNMTLAARRLFPLPPTGEADSQGRSTRYRSFSRMPRWFRTGCPSQETMCRMRQGKWQTGWQV